MQVFKKFQFCKSEISKFVKKMGLTGNPFLSFINFGQFDLFNPKPLPKRKQMALIGLIKVITFFNFLKLAAIVLAAWSGFLNLKFYLIEFYLFNENYQKFVDVAILILQIGFYSGFSFCSRLNENVSSLESFRFLLIFDPYKDRIDYSRFKQKKYHLDKNQIAQFLSAYRLACRLLKLLAILYSIFALATISRCLFHSFYVVSLAYFFSFCLLLWVISLISYVLLILYVLNKFLLVPICTKFLVLRLEAIDTLLRQTSIETKLI